MQLQQIFLKIMVKKLVKSPAVLRKNTKDKNVVFLLNLLFINRCG